MLDFLVKLLNFIIEYKKWYSRHYATNGAVLKDAPDDDPPPKPPELP